MTNIDTVNKGKRGRHTVVILLLFFLASFAGMYVQSYRSVNQRWKDAETVVYPMGEKVYPDEDILMDFTMKGYAFRVDKAEILEYQDYLTKYGGEDEYTFAPDRVYDVTLTLYNENAMDGVGINLQDIYISGKAWYASLNTLLLELANPKLQGSTAIALRENSEMQIHLPYGLNKETFRKENWENMNDMEANLIVTLYPTKKMIKLV